MIWTKSQDHGQRAVAGQRPGTIYTTITFAPIPASNLPVVYLSLEEKQLYGVVIYGVNGGHLVRYLSARYAPEDLAGVTESLERDRGLHLPRLFVGTRGVPYRSN